ncbi:hypothetical protein SeMB42_g07715 [Synchytrium endobioticum]|uniref:Uncharacterized protein n=1 Tax=Synchytrium endobioticum TaxID=286115 RepID=A0A507BW58_9FUNG|nr:hypothetical protein SeMB42_g07715 [Synchytrium endobioticum]TPX40072.1 hypothetical protein SeLEV6574_g06801 [Synchytrium endobioticum]
MSAVLYIPPPKSNTPSTMASLPSSANTYAAKRLSPDAVRHNARVINVARALLAVFAAIYLALMIFHGGQTGPGLGSPFTAPLIKYWGNPYGLWTDEVGRNLVSYVLFWTFAYGVVHVYD